MSPEIPNARQPQQSAAFESSLGARLARGATAEVFAYGESRVVKLLLAGRPRDGADREAKLGRTVRAAGIPAPEVHGVVEIDGRFGIVFERVDGPSMLDAIVAQPWRVLRLAPLLAELHTRIHRAALPNEARDGLRRLPSELARKIGQLPHLPPTERDRALERLAALESEYSHRAASLCHGDFHPGNIVLTARGPVVVDWNDATLGPAAADVARTELLVVRGELPASIGGAKRFAIQSLRRLLYALYLRRYRALTGIARADIDSWRMPVSIARQAEG